VSDLRGRVFDRAILFDLTARCAMCGVYLTLAVLTLCESCGERFCPGYCWRRHAEKAGGQ
jgi:hypothetical protein